MKTFWMKFMPSKKKLNESIDNDFFQRKVSDVYSVIEHVILSLQKNGSLTSKHQCMTIHNYLLCKIWEDILYASVSESGFGLPSIYLYIDMDSAGNDWTDVDKIIGFLKTMRAELLTQPTYADFVIYLSNAQNIFLSLEIWGRRH